MPPMEEDLKKLRWPVDIEKAKEIQRELSRKISLEPLKTTPNLVAGVDSAYSGAKIISVASLFTYPGLTPVEESWTVKDVSFPYVPGYLSFREGPSVLEAVAKLKNRPGLLIFDGQGIAHPRRLGIASFAGVLLEIPSIGCAKSKLVGEYEEPGEKKGSWTELKKDGDIIGAVVRSKDGVAPLFISPGHRIDLEGSIEVILKCTTKYRLPEPVRRADMLSRELKGKVI